ncbi:restriction endonuclease [Cellulosimicrobium sp. NPDC057127]|uniref:restriction endonuclease n=1 Tax=Cellulosimicrobium sp. NPDC057127 TaxID=3346026 RepID=UPI0036275C00
MHTPDDAEYLAAMHMRWLGLTDARVTPRGADAGVDVRSSRAIAQVKFRTNVTGRPDLQRLFGARGHADHLDLLFFVYVGYSAQALQYASEVGMLLFEYDVTGSVTAVNDLARRAHLAAVARERAQDPAPAVAPERDQQDPPSAAPARQWKPWSAGVVTLLVAAMTLTAFAGIGFLVWLMTLEGLAFTVTLLLGALSAAAYYVVYRSRRGPARARRAPASVPQPQAAAAVPVAPRPSTGVACEYDPQTRSVRRVLVSVTGGSVAFERVDGGHSTTLQGLTGFADPDEVRQARARARDELARLGQTPWL